MSGTITYAYDPVGNLCTKTSPAPNQLTGSGTQTISFSYDALNRLSAKAYNVSGCALTSPVATYLYDQTSYNGLTISNGYGRRTGMSDASGASAWSYDALGRIAAVRRKINGISHTATYSPVNSSTTYLNGELGTLTYFSGPTIGFTWGGADRPISAIDPAPINFVEQATYSPSGAITGSIIGKYNTGFTGTVVSNAYNNRLQPALLSAASPSMTVFSLSYNFNQISGTPSNNGSVAMIQNNRDNTRSQAFTYDPLNRIGSAQTSSSNLWGDTYVIDPWGNLTNKNLITGKGGENLQLNVSTKNQLVGFQYDIAGNMLADNLNNSYVYDAENRIISAGGMSYLYDGDGNRVEKCTAGTTAGTCASGATGTLYWRGKDTEVLNESDLGVTAWKRFVFFNGSLVARRDSATGNTYYFYSDHLGSVGVVTDVTGHTIENESDYYPYGGERVITNALSDEHYKFTGKERDPESSSDYFGARYYASSMGRFFTPDWSDNPVPIPYADLPNPQSLNLYGYVRNNPVGRTDADGHCDIDGEHHGWLWCAAHAVGITETAKETQARLTNEANGFIKANQIGLIYVNGQWVESGPATNAQLVDWWKAYNKDNQDNIAAGGRGLAFAGAAAGSLTTPQARDLAKYLGFHPVNVDWDTHGQAVFEKDGRYISLDKDSHSGGVWKEFDRRGNRIATLDVFLNKIGK